MMADVLTAQQRIDRAERRVDRFVARFEPTYYDLLCHTALPLVLTPELVSYLRNEFLRGIPWIAEVDLLLSDLCSPVGYELYSMDTDIRAYLLKKRSDTFDELRMQEVANLLISYVSYLAENSSLSDRELESQQWAALVYLGPLKQREAVDQIIKRFQECIVACGEQVGSTLLSQAEMTRLAQLTQTLRAELSSYPELIEFASLVSDVQLRNVALTKERVEKTYEVLPGQDLQLPSSLKDSLKLSGRLRGAEESSIFIDTAVPTVSSADTQLVQDISLSFPSLETLRFLKGELVDKSGLSEDNFPPPLKTATFQTATISLPQQQTLDVFEFKAAKIKRERAGLFRRFQWMVKKSRAQARRFQWVVKKSRAQARRFVEPLTNDLALEMVAIPSGTFLMGSPENEPERFPSEGPQHEVTISDFFMGRYLVTQAQWQSVANLPQVNQGLNPNPSNFKGDDFPVENVSWYEAVEFCDRLSAHTDRAYRLPTEAEWEYACRAGTVTPFCSGDMILTEVANYNGNYAYADGSKGEYRGKTNSINEFDVANAFGLSDMHGNVWEWCQDHWHANYDGAPNDGSAWLTNKKKAERIRRGGSWGSYPRDCRSASRVNVTPASRNSLVGFRVSCLARRT